MVEHARGIRMRRLGGRDRPEAEALLQDEPVVRVALRGLLEERPASRVERDRSSRLSPRAARCEGFWGLYRGGRLMDVCFRSERGGVLATACGVEAGQAWGGLLGGGPGRVLRLVTDWSSGNRVVEGFVAWGGTVLLQRPQLLYVLTPSSLEPLDLRGLRRARPSEAAAVARMGLLMDREDVPVPGLRTPSLTESHVASVRARIRAGGVFVVDRQGEIVFKADACFAGRCGAQLEGVYTVPSRRGRGLASRGMAAIARRLLARSPFVTLHVAASNGPARRAYERAGFRFHSDHFLAVLASTGGRTALEGWRPWSLRHRGA